MSENEKRVQAQTYIPIIKQKIKRLTKTNKQLQLELNHQIEKNRVLYGKLIEYEIKFLKKN